MIGFPRIARSGTGYCNRRLPDIVTADFADYSDCKNKTPKYLSTDQKGFTQIGEKSGFWKSLFHSFSSVEKLFLWKSA
jgi:hypothetical protein